MPTPTPIGDTMQNTVMYRIATRGFSYSKYRQVVLLLINLSTYSRPGPLKPEAPSYHPLVRSKCKKEEPNR